MFLHNNILVTLNSPTSKYYKSLGYSIPTHIDKNGRVTIKCGTELLVKTKDLPPQSNIKVSIVCDSCGKENLDEERKRKHNVSNINKWRKEVLQRDNHTCQCCGSKRNLFVHHLNNFSDFKEHRTNVDNGITLCKDCHYNFHKIYGFKHTTKNMFENFLNSIISKTV